MKNKIFISSVIITLICSHSLFASSLLSQNNNDSKCPDVNAIKAVGLAGADGNADGWGAYQRNKYDTPYLWNFMIGKKRTPILAKYDNEAMDIANKAMQTLKFKEVQSGTGFIFCVYTAGYNAQGFATTSK